MSTKPVSKSPKNTTESRGENPSVLQIQQRLVHARRLLRDNDSRLELSLRERRALLAEREAIQADVHAAALCYRDARAAGWLREQGAGAVAAVEGWLEG